jgi:hypothetical protein
LSYTYSTFALVIFYIGSQAFCSNQPPTIILLPGSPPLTPPPLPFLLVTISFSCYSVEGGIL